jgi:hypothetical protein
MIAPAFALLAIIAGAAAGACQMASLARAARGRAKPVATLARFLLVGTVFVAAARNHELAAVTIGWILGSLAGGAHCYRRIT